LALSHSLVTYQTIALGGWIANTAGFKICCVFFVAEEEGGSFEDVEHNENILTLGLVG